jgi:hypothetical protein
MKPGYDPQTIRVCVVIASVTKNGRVKVCLVDPAPHAPNTTNNIYRGPRSHIHVRYTAPQVLQDEREPVLENDATYHKC